MAVGATMSYDPDELEAELFSFEFELPSACTKQVSMVPVTPLHVESVKGKATCSPTPFKRIGNLTINTIRRTNLVSHMRTPIKRVIPGSSPIRVNVDKENIPPPSCDGKREYRFGALHSSPVFPFRNKQVQPLGPPEIDLDDLECMIRNSSSHSNLCSPASSMIVKTEADELESLLFSQDIGSDVFLYDSEAASEFDPKRPRTARSTSMVSVHSLKSTRPKPRIEIKVLADKSALPTLKTGSTLRKMILPGDTPAKKTKRNTENDSSEEYKSFVDKIHMDEPVEGSSEDEDDDEFKVQPEDEPHVEDEEEPSIPRKLHVSCYCY